MSKIETVINDMEEFIEGCNMQLLSQTKIVVEKDELLAMLDDLRDAIPKEIAESRKILSNQDEILRQSQAQAESRMAEVNRMAEQLVDENEIMQRAYNAADEMERQARAHADDIIARATNEANNIRSSAISYTDEVLRNLQAIISHAIEGTQGRFDQYLSSMKDNFDIVTQNREQLSHSISDGNEADN